MLTYKEKHHIANKEAAWSAGGVVVIALFWAIGGFALKDLEIDIAGIPLWAICGTIGTWIVAIAIVVFLSRFIFTDMPFEDEGQIMNGSESDSAHQPDRPA